MASPLSDFTMTVDVEHQTHPDGNVSVLLKTDHVTVVWAAGSPEGIRPALEELAYLLKCKAYYEWFQEESKKFRERMRREAGLFDY